MALKQLEISTCPELECIAKDFEETTGLESIKLLCCHQIKSLPRGLDKLRHLQQIEIDSCPNLVSLEESGLPSATNLGVLSIKNCENFGALPNCFNYFTSLRGLRVSNCAVDISFPEEGLPTNLTSLEISKAPKIYRSLVEWGLDRLTSLQQLAISGEGCSDVVSFPEEKLGMMLPPSLTRIEIGNLENLKYMFSKGFQNLTYFESLFVYECSKLTALPDKEVFLSLEKLFIHRCPLLKENCKRDEGRMWSSIAHIPFVLIDGEIIIPRELN